MPSGLKRHQGDGQNHFLTFSCYRRLPFLNTDPARSIFLQELERLRIRHNFFVFGYVLMPEHVHLLVSEPKAHSLATTLNVLKHETSQRLKEDRKQFWQRRYYDFNVCSHDKFVEKLQYIHRNPVVRGLVTKPEDWPWSSFNHWAIGEPSGRNRISLDLDQTRTCASRLVSQAPTEDHFPGGRTRPALDAPRKRSCKRES